MALCFLALFTASLLLPENVCMEIIGGKEAKPHSRPYMALINTKGCMCGGTLIDSSWVLTAAHCTINASTTIILGLHFLRNQGQSVQKFKALQWFTHDYDNKTEDNDVQLVKLSGKAKLNKAVKPLKLPTTSSDVKAGTICESAGWGITRNDVSIASDKLMEVSLPVISREKCAAMWYPRVITENMMCTLYANGGKDTCRGDSGGPLICQGKFRGVVSFGPDRCGDPQRPAVYAFLTKDHINWIKRQIKKKLSLF